MWVNITQFVKGPSLEHKIEEGGISPLLLDCLSCSADLTLPSTLPVLRPLGSDESPTAFRSPDCRGQVLELLSLYHCVNRFFTVSLFICISC